MKTKIATYILLSCIALLLGGCLAKSTAPTQYFLLNANTNKCEQNIEKTSVTISETKFLDAVESREILVIDNVKMRTFENAKFINLPSEMISQSLILAVNNSCDFYVSLDGGYLRLDSKILSLQIKQNYAQITIGYSIFKENKLLKSEILDKNIKLKEQGVQAAVIGLNDGLNEIIKEILENLKEFR
jgi:50S ribosomal protein L5 (BL6)